MLTTERRIAALESSASDTALKIVIVLDGETKAQALKRVGLPPDAQRLVLATVEDALL